VSCHKFFGFPAPAGLFITTKSRFEEFNELFGRIHDPEYIRQVPGTITCSRDAVKPAEFYYFSTPEAQARLAKDAQSMLANTSWLMERMQSRFSGWQPARMNELSNTVFFRRPSGRLVKKYSLATMHLTTGPQRLDYAHVVVMPHAGRDVLTEFLDDLEKDAPDF
jgi:histidine decarboxylase